MTNTNTPSLTMLRVMYENQSNLDCASKVLTGALSANQELCFKSIKLPQDLWFYYQNHS